MRLFTKLRAEEIAAIAYPDPVVIEPVVPAETRSASEVKKTTPIAGAKSDDDKPGAYKDEKTSAETNPPLIVLTTLHGESHQFPKDELLLSPIVAERKEPAGPIVGDWFVSDYDILTDKRIRKVYDAKTFTNNFKASLTG